MNNIPKKIMSNELRNRRLHDYLYVMTFLEGALIHPNKQTT